MGIKVHPTFAISTWLPCSDPCFEIKNSKKLAEYLYILFKSNESTLYN
jgi:hypothetical protein